MLESPNNVYEIGDLSVICLAPDTWEQPTDTLTDYILPANTLDWLDAQLSASSRPTFIATHAPPDRQYPDDSITADGQNPRLNDIIGAHSNVIGWLSGHRHNIIEVQPEHAETINVARQQLFALCGPSTGGMSHLNVRQRGPIEE